MQIDRKWLNHELAPAFGSERGVDEGLAQLGVGPDDSHVSLMVILAVALDLVRSRNDEMCGLAAQSVAFGTWEMILRSMSTGRTLASAVQTMIQTSEVFCLPYKILVRDLGTTVRVEVSIQGAEVRGAAFLGAAYGRLVWSAFCWFCGQKITLIDIFFDHSFYEFDHRNLDGTPLRPIESLTPGTPSMIADDRHGFTMRKSELSNHSAIRRDSNPLIESFKWFAILNHDGNTTAVKSRPGPAGATRLPGANNRILYGNSFSPHKADDERILQAKVLLSSTNKTIPEISFDLGFPIEQDFRRNFQQKTAKTPTQYRKINAENDLTGSDYLLNQILEVFK